MKKIIYLSLLLLLLVNCSQNKNQNKNYKEPQNLQAQQWDNVSDSIRIDTSRIVFSRWEKDIYTKRMQSYKEKYHDLYTKNLVTPYLVEEKQIDDLCKKMIKGFMDKMNSLVEKEQLYIFQYPELSKKTDIDRCKFEPIYGYLITANVFDYVDSENQRFGDFITLDTTFIIMKVIKDNKFLTILPYHRLENAIYNWTSDKSTIEDIQVAKQYGDSVIFIRYLNGGPKPIGFLKNGEIYFIENIKDIDYFRKTGGMYNHTKTKPIKGPLPATDYIMARGNSMFEHYETAINRARNDTTLFYRNNIIKKDPQVKLFPEQDKMN